MSAPGWNRYIDVDSWGRYVAHSDSPFEHTGIMLSATDRDRMAAHPERFRYDAESSEWIEMAKVRLSLSCRVFDGADYDEGVLMVLGIPEGAGAVQVSINGVIEEMANAEPMYFRHDAEKLGVGRWHIELVDPRFYAEPDEYDLIARLPVPDPLKGLNDG